MVKKTGLGKGIAALLPVVEEEGRRFFSCPIEEIRPGEGQPRKTFSEEKLLELAGSIREKGIIQPLVVRKKSDHYELIAGERRWRAAQKAGLREVPVVIQEVSDREAMELALIENIQREDLNAIEEAEAYRALIDSFQLSQEDLAGRVGKDRSTIANSLRLLKLPADVRQDVAEERLSMGHARALLALGDAGALRRARDEVVKKALNVRQTETLVKNLSAPKKPVAEQPRNPDIEDLTERLKRRFGARIAIRSVRGKGKIEIPFTSEDDLARIIELLEAP